VRLSRLVLVVGLAAGSAPAPVSAQTQEDTPVWRIDRTHSELTFRIRHLVSRVSGGFADWGGTLVVDPANLADGSVEVTIHTASITTQNERRDADLRSERFFDVARFPAITFKSTSIDMKGSDIQVYGNLTIRDVTRPVVLVGEYIGRTGVGTQERLGFEASIKLDRMDYGVTWNRVAEGGGTLLGDEVTISIAIAAVRVPAGP